MKPIKSYNELLEKMQPHDTTYLLLHKNGSEQSKCALDNLKKASEKNSEIKIFTADVNTVRDIHTKYNITSVPALLAFEDSEFKNVIKGCHDADYIINLFEHAIYTSKIKKGDKSVKRVVVYTSPTCHWCNTLKNYLRKNNIRFREIDISKNQQKAKELVRKSGQQGVPQTEINGQIVVGFDQAKLNRLLEISS